MVAQVAMPDRPWRLVSSAKTHTTVWDGAETLFDTNFLALGIDPNEAWEMAAKQPDSEVMEPSQFHFHGHCGEYELVEKIHKKGLLPQIKFID